MGQIYYIQLTNELSAGIKIRVINTYRQQPLKIENKKVIYQDSDPKKSYYFEHIKYKDIVIVNKESIAEFEELLNSFLSKQLSINKVYIVESGGDEIGCKIKISTQNKIHYLEIAVPNQETTYLDKYTCLILIKKLDKIKSSCKYL